MKSLVISSGSIVDYEFLEEQVRSCDYIICADGGLDHLIKIDEKPDVILGDLDSISKEALKFIEENDLYLKKYPVMKNETDTELAIFHALEMNSKEIILVGALGGNRMDHSLANIFLLEELYNNNIRAKIIDETNIIEFTGEYLRIEKKKDFKVSLIPMTDEGLVVTLKGFLYPLDRYHIKRGETIGISNEVFDDYGEIIIHRGKALVLQSKD